MHPLLLALVVLVVLGLLQRMFPARRQAGTRGAARVGVAVALSSISVSETTMPGVQKPHGEP